MNPILEELLARGVSPIPGGGELPLQSHVLRDEAEFLESLVRDLAPRATLEIGLAFGVSALAICDGTALLEGARHVVMDPRQNARPLWAGAGLHNLRRAGFEHRVEFYEEPSHRVLARLEAEDRRFDFAFIDGMHLFDFALVDFFFIHRLLSVGGVVAFDDADWASVHRVVRFVATNLPYAVHATLPPRRNQWSRKRRLYEAVRGGAGAALGGLAGAPGIGRAVRDAIKPEWLGVDPRLRLAGPCVALRKMAEDSRRYDHHVDF